MSSAAPRDSTSFEVREALDQGGCPVCRLALRSVGRWLASVAYEQVNDIKLRDRLRAARGFCNVHAHRWLREVGSVLGTAIVYQDLLTAALREIDGENVQRGQRWRAILGGPGPAAADPHALDGSEGLCVRHARAAQRRGGPGTERMVQLTRSAVERLLAELSEVIRKEDYRFRHERRTDAERTATARAVARAAGPDGLVDT